MRVQPNQIIYGGGSPLDVLPVAPSCLPLKALIFEPESSGLDQEQIIRDQLAESEQSIIQRSNAVEQHWSCDRWRADPVIVETLGKLVHFLNYVDYECHKSTPIQAGAVFRNYQDAYKSHPDETACIVDQLYETVFENKSSPKNQNPESENSSSCETEMNQRGLAVQDATIGALCQWAITTERRGTWRCTLIAKLLERRLEVLSNAGSENNNNTDIPETSEIGNPSVNPPVNTSRNNINLQYTTQLSFQTSILKFLEQAPMLTDTEDLEEIVKFQQLMQLMGELIRHDVFNYNNYLNFMICRTEVQKYKLRTDDKNNGDLNEHNARGLADAKTSCYNQVLGSDESVSGVYDVPKDNEFLWGYGQPRHIQYIFHMPLCSSTAFEWMDFEKNEKNDESDVIIEIDSTDSKLKNENEDKNMDCSENDMNLDNSSKQKHPTDFEVISDFFESAQLQNERNQRLVMLYGTGKQKSNLQANMHKLAKQLTKAIFRMDLKNPKKLNSKSSKFDSKNDPKQTKSPENADFENLSKTGNTTPEIEVVEESSSPAAAAAAASSSRSERQLTAEKLEEFRLQYAIKLLYSRGMFERNAICCQVVKHVLIALHKFSQGSTNQLPSVSGIVRLMSLLDSVCFAPHILVAFCARLASLAKPIEQKLRNIKQTKTRKQVNGKKIPEKPINMAQQQSGYFTRAVGLNSAAVARQHHALFVIEAPDSCSLQMWFDGFWSLVKNSHPSECSSAERNIFFVLYEQWSTCQGLIKSWFQSKHEADGAYQTQIDWIIHVLGWPEDKATGLKDPPRATKQNPITRSVHTVLKQNEEETENLFGRHDPDLLADIIEFPHHYLNRTSPKKISKEYFQNETVEAAGNRYSFISNVIIKTTSGNCSLDLVSHLGALAAEFASYAPKFSQAWIAAIVTIVTSQNTLGTHTLGSWQDCLMKINFGDTGIYEPLATLIVSLIARGVIDMDNLIQNCVATIIELIWLFGNGQI